MTTYSTAKFTQITFNRCFSFFLPRLQQQLSGEARRGPSPTLDFIWGTNRSGAAAGRSEEAREEALQRDQARRDDINDRRRQREAAATIGDSAETDPAPAVAQVNGHGNPPPAVNPRPPFVMAEFMDQDDTDGTKALANVQGLKFEFDRHDIKTWLRRFEVRLEFLEVKSQWLKRVALENAIPVDIATSCNDLFDQTKTQVTAATDAQDKLIYKKCKLRLLKVYGPRPEEAFEKALTLPLVGLPSDAAKQIRALVCPGVPPMQGCHCHIAISSIWRKLLSKDVRGAIANLDLQTNFDQTIEAADVYHKAYLAGARVAAVSHANPAAAPAHLPAPAGAQSNFSDLDSLAAHFTAEIAAFRGTTRNFRGSTRGQSNQRYPRSGQQQQARRPPPTRKPQPHTDGPPASACINHWNHGKGAYSCSARDTCPWKDFLTKRPQRQ